MRLFYSAFGLVLSADRPIPGLMPRQPVVGPQTLIRLDARSPAPSGISEEVWYWSGMRERSEPALKVWRRADGAGFRLLYGDGTEFLVSRDGSDVRASWPAPLTVEDAATYLLGPVLGFVLRLRGVTCLHASAVAVDGRAFALLGPAGAGKSTLAAAFAQLGHPVVSDDVTALLGAGERFSVQPGYPQLRLWPESVALLYGQPDALPRLTPTWDKRALDLTRNGYRFQDGPLPLAGVYVLGDRRAGAAPRVETLRGRAKLLALLANTYVGYLLDRTMRAQELATLGRLAASVPVRRVVGPADPSGLGTLCTCILEDARAL